MRDGGNEHESSWEAAYTYIKKQKGGFFKVSPKQAAAQIVETVVREQRKIGRNEKVTIKNLSTGETKKMKFKQAEKLIQSGSWIIT